MSDRKCPFCGKIIEKGEVAGLNFKDHKWYHAICALRLDAGEETEK
jgi:hypothetical protein